jgi:hypothetical protein
MNTNSIAISPAIAAQIAEIEQSNNLHQARLTGLTEQQRVLADYLHYKAISEKYGEFAKECNDSIKDWAELTGESIELDGIVAKVGVSERVKWDEDLAQAILGGRCPLKVAVDTKKLETMEKAGQLAQAEIARIKTITEVKTLRVAARK